MERDDLLFGGLLNASECLQYSGKKSKLGMICFSENQDSDHIKKIESTLPCLHVPMRNLSSDEASCEVWLGADALLQQGIAGDIQYQYDHDALFGVIHLPESAFQWSDDKTPLQQAAESAYCQIFALAEQLNFPHLFRFWNYIAEINAESYALERYRQFNMGRYDAFLAFQRAVEGNVPAACALGYAQKGQEAVLSIAFLAGRVQSLPIENPRQISAYEYPKEYGPVSPTFSRASLVKLKQSELLLISGTASIVGHATQHTTDAIIQAREAITNIEAVLAQANTQSTHQFILADLHYRVYVRHPVHVNDIHEVLTSDIGMQLKVTYLHADICRQDLLLEIEATAEYPNDLPVVMRG